MDVQLQVVVILSGVVRRRKPEDNAVEGPLFSFLFLWQLRELSSTGPVLIRRTVLGLPSANAR
jgi:hypothetical protein